MDLFCTTWNVRKIKHKRGVNSWRISPWVWPSLIWKTEHCLKIFQFTSDASWPNINHNKKRTLLSLLQNFENGVACVEEWKTVWQQWGVFFCNDFVCKEHSKGEVKCDTCANPYCEYLLDEKYREKYGSENVSDIQLRHELNYRHKNRTHKSYLHILQMKI